jgi:BMFP domain-containing protein YqiC
MNHLGLDPSKQTGDALHDSLTAAAAVGIGRMADRMLGGADPTARAQASRTFDRLSEIGTTPAANEATPTENALNEKFLGFQLSGEEAHAAMAGVLGNIEGSAADKIRDHLSLSRPTENVTGPEASEAPFTPEEADIASVAVAASIEYAAQAKQLKRNFKPQNMLSDTKRIVEEFAATSQVLTGTKEERLAVVARVFDKLPSLMRQQFEDQQQMIAQTKADIDKL